MAKAGPPKDFLLVSTTGVLHHVPTHEECNVDQVPHAKRLRFVTYAEAKGHPKYRRDCKHCRIVALPNPEPQHGTGALIPDHGTGALIPGEGDQ